MSADITSGCKASLRSLMIVIPTTRRPVVIVSLKPRPNLPASFVVAEGDFRALPITPDYDWLIGPSGPVGRRVPDAARSSQELKLSESFESGRSWEVPVSLAHLLAASGRRLTARAEDADLLLWSTGAVDVDLNIADQNYFLEEKLRRSLDLFAAAKGKTIIAFMPSCGSGIAELAPDLREQLAALDVELVPIASVLEAFNRLTTPAQSLETGARGAGSTSSSLLSSLIRPWIALGLLLAASASVAAGFLAGPTIFLHFLHDTRRIPQDRDTAQPNVAKTKVSKSAPETDVPKTDVAKTDVAKTDLSKADVPQANVPNTDLAKADVPNSHLPNTDLPNTGVPNTDLPTADVPRADVSRTDVSRTEMSKTDGSKTDGSKTDAPKTDAPKTDVSAADVPEMAKTHIPDVPRADVPKTEVPKHDEAKTDVATTDVGKTDVGKTDVAKTNVAKTEVPKTEVPKTDEAKTDEAKTDGGKTEVAKTEVPKTEVAKADVTSAKLPERSPDQPQSTGPDAMMVLEELRAPARLSCIDVLFSGAAPEVHVLTAAGGRFPPSHTAGLCGLRARVTAPSAANRAPAYKVDFDAAFLAISMPGADDPGSRALGHSSRMFRRDAPGLLSYRIVMRSLPGAANPLELQFTHELRR